MCAELSPAVGESRQLEQRLECEHFGRPQQQQREQRVPVRPGLLLTVPKKAYTQYGYRVKNCSSKEPNAKGFNPETIPA